MTDLGSRARKQAFDYRAADGTILFQVERTDMPDGGKTFRQRRHDGKGGWIPNLKDVGPVPYRLPELLEAVAIERPVFIVEGEKKVELLRSWGVPATCSSGGAGKWRDEHSRHLAGAAVVILPDNDDPGRKHADKAAASLAGAGASVRILELPGLGQKGDIVDWAKDGGTVDQLYKLVDTSALPWGKRANGEASHFSDAGGNSGADGLDDKTAGPLSDDELDAEIAKLAAMKLPAYERVRRDAAIRLGVRASILDKIVAAKRPAEDGAPGQGRTLELPSSEPWHETVDGPELVAELTALIRRYVVLTDKDAITAALWAVHCSLFDAFPCTPRLAITSPEKRCGKSLLMDIVALLVPRALPCANVTAAAVFRTVELAKPVLLIDEADTFFEGHDELRGILNSGHRAGGQVIRTVGDDHEPRIFATHCPAAIAMIGKLPDTLADRSVTISMKRRSPSEMVAKFRQGRTPEITQAAMKIARWTEDHAEDVRKCDAPIPGKIFNRAADNWEPLLAIAEVMGGDVPEQARNAALAACGAEEELSFSTQLLVDIRGVFATITENKISSADLVAKLTAMTDRPWGECNHGKALTQNWLSRQLRKFGIRPTTVRIGSATPKGFTADDFADAFKRYISPETAFPSATPQQINDNNMLGDKPTATLNESVAVEKSRKCSKINRVADVADGNQESIDESESGGSVSVPSLAEQGLAAANRGHDWLSAFWSELTPEERKAAGGQDALMAWKFIAARVRAGR